MEVLEQIFLENPKKFHINDRKVKIYNQYTHLFGGSKCGKSFIILNHLFVNKKDGFLYIDYEDMRIDNLLSFQMCVDFCKSKDIHILAIENSPYEPHKIDGLEIIVSSNTKTQYEGFETIALFPLDFEEYISFAQKQLDEPNIMFSAFLKDGNLPQKVGKSDYAKLKITQSIIQNISQNRTKSLIFQYMCQNSALKLTFLQMYNYLKNSTKISKDSLYRYADELENESVVYFLEKYGQQNGAKKIYVYDFSMLAAVTLKKEPLRAFENMVFLELAKHNQEIYYDDGVDFLIPEANRAVLARAFASEKSIANRLLSTVKKLKSFEIEILEIVTMGSEFSFDYENVTIEAVPFWIWALKD